jgi:hypothetical protein
MLMVVAMSQTVLAGGKNILFGSGPAKGRFEA